MVHNSAEPRFQPPGGGGSVDAAKRRVSKRSLHAIGGALDHHNLGVMHQQICVPVAIGEIAFRAIIDLQVLLGRTRVVLALSPIKLRGMNSVTAACSRCCGPVQSKYPASEVGANDDLSGANET